MVYKVSTYSKKKSGGVSIPFYSDQLFLLNCAVGDKFQPWHIKPAKSYTSNHKWELV